MNNNKIQNKSKTTTIVYTVKPEYYEIIKGENKSDNTLNKTKFDWIIPIDGELLSDFIENKIEIEFNPKLTSDNVIKPIYKVKNNKSTKKVNKPFENIALF